MKLNLLLLLTLFIALFAYLPGLDQRLYTAGDYIDVKTRKLFSKKDLPFDFYSLPFCRPNPLLYSAKNLGEVMFGDRIENSLYQVCPNLFSN